MRNSLGLNDSYKFGVEIEFQNLNLQRLYSSLKQNDFPVNFLLKHKEQ